jgi:hypothetical protein
MKSSRKAVKNSPNQLLLAVFGCFWLFLADFLADNIIMLS